MKIVDIRLYRIDKDIQINLNYFLFDEPPIIATDFNQAIEITLMGKVPWAMLNENYYPNDQVLKELNRKKETKNLVVANQKVEMHIILFRLPANPAWAIDFLLALYQHLETENFDAIHLNAVPLDNISDYLNNSVQGYDANTALRKITENILAFYHPYPGYKDKYEPVFNALENIKQFKLRNPQIPFNQYLHLNQRFGGLIKHWLHELEPSNEDSLMKMKALFSLLKKFIRENNLLALNHLIANNNYSTKKDLYRPCLGQEAHDHKNYSWSYTEWYLLRNAHFHLRTDGRLSINLKNNSAYKINYINKPRLYVIGDELKHLGKIIGLEFEQDSDFSGEVIFTSSCSKRLMNAGLHFDVPYVKNLLKIKHRFDFFSRIYAIETDKTGTPNNLHLLPLEVFSNILEKAESSSLASVEKKDAVAICKLAWSPRFLSKVLTTKTIDDQPHRVNHSLV